MSTLFIKLFKTNNIRIVQLRQELFDFDLLMFSLLVIGNYFLISFAFTCLSVKFVVVLFLFFVFTIYRFNGE